MNSKIISGQTPVDEIEGRAVIAHAPELDVSDYLSDLTDLDLDEAQASELLDVLWDISRMMVELGFSTELRDGICEQLFEGVDGISDQFAGAVESPRSAISEARSTIGKDGSHGE